MPTLTTRLKIAAWDENPVKEFDDGTKVTRAAVTLEEGADGLTAGSSQSTMYYRADGTSTFVDVMWLSGTLDGRTGTFFLTGTGGYDGKTASSTSRIVPGSGTGDLAGITGTCTSESTHDDYPYMPLTVTYQLG